MRYGEGLLFGLLLCVCVVSAEELDVAGQRHCLSLENEQSICVYEYNPQADGTVVLIHGLNGTARRDWVAQIRLLARQHHVLAVELPGFDDPEQLPEHYTTGYFANAVALLLEHYAKPSYTLVGHSMGGIIALHLALEQPERIARMVLVSVPGLLHRLSYSREVIGGWAGASSGNHSGLSAFVEKLGIKLLAGLEAISGRPQPSDRVLRMMSDNPLAMAAMQLATQDFSKNLHRVNVPVLLFWGEHDRIAPPRTAHALLARLPHSRLQIFPDVGHVPMTQATEAFNRSLQAFVMAGRWPEPSRQYSQQEPMVEKSGRVAHCKGQHGMVLEGDYDLVTIQSCEAILIRNARVASLRVRSSRVEIMYSQIGSPGGTGLHSHQADIKVTASELFGQAAIVATGSRIDLAGVNISAEAAVHIQGNTDVLLSLSEWRQGDNSRYLHGYYQLAPGGEVSPDAAHGT